MSSVYLTEPPTQGKILIKTSMGDIDVELWAKEAPLACRNFIQLSLEGYYDGTVVHRVIKDFMVQMGDPSGTGKGGKSIWGRPFKDEIHGRLKFNHRGQVAMANENSPNTNHSQFFITLDACEWLDRKHTIFGKVTGNTMFNVLRMGEVEVDNNDKPTDEDIIIKTVEVLWNPFDDIVPRDLGDAHKTSTTESSSTKDSKNASNGGIGTKEGSKKPRDAVRNKKLLSFGAEDGNEFDGEDSDADAANESAFGNTKTVIKTKMHSSHDSKFKDKKLSSRVHTSLRKDLHNGKHDMAEEAYTSNSSSNGAARGHYNSDRTEESLDKKEDSKISRSSSSSNSSSGSVNRNVNQQTRSSDRDDGVDRNSMDQMISDATRGVDLRQKSAEYKKIRDDLLRTRRAVNVLTGAEAEKERKEEQHQALVTPLEQRRQKYLKRKNEHGDRSDETMSKLMKFASSLKSSKAASTTSATAPAESTTANGRSSNSKSSNDKHNKADEDHYHGQLLEKGDRIIGGSAAAAAGSGSGGVDDADDDLKDWFQGKLKCKRHIDDNFRGIGESATSAGGRASSSSSSSSSSRGSDGRYLDDYLVIDPRQAR